MRNFEDPNQAFQTEINRLDAGLRYDGVVSCSIAGFACTRCHFVTTDCKTELTVQQAIERDGDLSEALLMESVLNGNEIAKETTAYMALGALPDWQSEAANQTQCNDLESKDCEGMLLGYHIALPPPIFN